MNIWGLIFTSIYYFLEIGVYFTTLHWLNDLEKSNCQCSDTYHRRYIQVWCQIYIVIMTIIFIYNIYTILNVSDEFNIENTSTMLQFSLTFFSFVNVIVSIYYINKLKKDKCICSESLVRETYYIFNWIKLISSCFFAFIILILAIGVIYQIISNKNTSWWFSFQNSKIEISNNTNKPSTFSFQNVSKKKPKYLLAFSMPKTKN